MVVEGDAFESDSCERIVRRTLEAFGRIDILVSNPAHSRRGDFLDYAPETFDEVLRGTLFGGFHGAVIGGAIGGGVALADTLRKRGPDLTLPTGTELNYQLTRELAIQ